MNETPKGQDKIFLEDTDTPLPESVRNTDMRYTEYKLLAKGGKAIIQTCKDNYLGRVVCHKSLRKEFIGNKEEEARFLREARVTAMLQHPNTIPIYDISRNNQGHYFFTMKLVKGRTLEAIILALQSEQESTVEEFKLERFIGMLIQLGNALSYAHAHGVIHRDIKPANIVIGPFGEVWVLDWGLAKVWKMDKDEDEDLSNYSLLSSNKDLSLTGHGKIEATPLYMSPEQITSSRSVDFRSDIYNFGALFYEILTLEAMAGGGTIPEIFERTKNELPELPSKKSPQRLIPKELEEICMKCVQKDPEDRYQTIKEVVKDLRAFRENKYISK